MDLRDKVAIVTGGNGGLGQRICHALARSACHVAVIYAGSRDQAREVAGKLRSHGVEGQAFQCDVSDPVRVDRMVQEVEKRLGRIDILVNDAAFNIWIPFRNLHELTNEIWDKIIGINLTGPMLLTRAVAPAMKRQGAGRIVNISSIAGLGPTGSSIPYSVSKAALIHLTKCMAVALAPEVTVNCLAPGHLEGTRATSNLSTEFRAESLKTALLKKAADKDDIAYQVVAFCQADTITGQTLVIDSGKVFH